MTRARAPALRESLATLAADVGLVLHLTTALVAATVPVALVAGERWALLPLIVTGAAAGLVGQLLHRRYQAAERHTPRTAIAVVASAWITTGLLAALLLWWLAGAAPPDVDAVRVYRDPTNALFEGISGITSTGLTIAHGLESALPSTVQFWRSLLQWVGAIGVVVFTLSVITTGAGGQLLYEAATRPELLGDDVRTTTRRILTLYLGLTVAAVGALWVTGLDGWTALNHGLSGIGTGGFTVTDASFADHPPAARYAGAIVILVGATSFVALQQLLVRRDARGFLRRTQVRALGAMFVGGLALLALAARAGGADVAFVDLVFQWATAVATAGFSSVDLATWTPALLLLLIVAMTVGGASGSTAGGLKLSRVAWLGKALLTRLRAAEPGQRELQHRWDGEDVAPDHSRRAEAHAGGMVLLWVTTLAAGTLLLLLLAPGHPPLHVLFDVSSALSNVGLSTGVVDRSLAGGPKAVLTVLMVLGRLEILGLVVLARAVLVPTGSPTGAEERPPAGA